MIQSTPLKRAVSVAQPPNGAAPKLPAPSPRFGRLLGRALGILGGAAILLSPPAFGADPAKEATRFETIGSMDSHSDSGVSNETSKAASIGEKEQNRESLLARAMTKAATTGGIDPHGDSWLSIQHSLQQFAHIEFMLRLFFNLTLSVGCSWVIARNPRRSRRVDVLADLEERKALIILGVVGAIVAELSGTNPTLAFVIFGIGALLRFRTVLDNPKATGKAILVVVIGLACGMGSWTMAVFVTAFSWALLYWLDSHLPCNMTIRLNGDVDPKPLQLTLQSVLVSHGCRLESCTLSKGNKRMEFLFHMPAGLDPDQLESEVKAKLPKTGDSRVSIKEV